MEVVLGMFFLTLSNTNIQFAERELVRKTYSAIKTLLMTPRVEIIDKKEFVAVALNKKDKIFVVYIVALSVDSNVYAFQRAQISSLDIEKVTIPSKYADYTDVFPPNSAAKLIKYSGINNYTINLIDNKQPFYSPIYSLGPVELEILKSYIETNLANGFIIPSHSPAGALIVFIRNKNGSL